MNLVNFCENRFQELSLEAQLDPAYNYKRDAELKAIHFILNEFRGIARLVMIPKCLYDFARVNLGYAEEPKAVLIERAKKAQAEALAKKEAESVSDVH